VYTPAESTEVVIDLVDFPVVWWAPNQTTDPPSALLTGSWVVAPRSLRNGFRPAQMQLTFEDCDLGTSNKIVVFPLAFPSFGINLTDPLQVVPSYAVAIRPESFNTSSGNSTTVVMNCGEVFIAFKCCVALGVTMTGDVIVDQYNTTCRIRVRALAEREMIPSLRLLVGLAVVLVVPGLAVTLAFCLIRPGRDEKRRDVGFQKRSGKWQCGFFWISFPAAFIVFVVAFLVKMY
jgi:hypothetical protein